MSVIGIDFGNQSCYIAAVKSGAIETLVNEYGVRAIPSCVAFNGRKRMIGSEAVHQRLGNLANTVTNLKSFLGRVFGDPHVKRELEHSLCKVQPKGSSLEFRVKYLDKEHGFTVEQLTAILFTKLKDIAEKDLNGEISDCVISCPLYFTNLERAAILDAARIAGWNVLRLINDTTATALMYGLYNCRVDKDKGRHVIFVDCGHTAVQVSACHFLKDQMRMLASTWDRVGGRDFDNALADYFIKEFNDSHRFDVVQNAQEYQTLLLEVEKVKRQLSANSSKRPTYVEASIGKTDVTFRIDQSRMNELCAPLLQRIERTLRAVLQEARLTATDIDSIEIVGGSVRIPAIKQLIERVFGKAASATLYQDESVCIGAALRGALLVPTIRVRSYTVRDVINHGVNLCWESSDGYTAGKLEAFSAFHPAPASLNLTFYRRKPFTLELHCTGSVPAYPNTLFGRFFFKGFKAQKNGKRMEIKIKVRIDGNGFVTIASAESVEILENLEPKSFDIEEQTSNALGEEGNQQDKSTHTQLSFEAHIAGISPSEIKTYTKLENKMRAADDREKQRMDARNSLEEFLYEMRDNLETGGIYEAYAPETERYAICLQMGLIAEWLEGDGSDCDTETYMKKLQKMRKLIALICERQHKFEKCRRLIEELKSAATELQNVLGHCRMGSPVGTHIAPTDLQRFTRVSDNAQKWLDDQCPRFQWASRYSRCPLSSSDIKRQLDAVTGALNAIDEAKQTLAAADQTVPENAEDVQCVQNGGD